MFELLVCLIGGTIGGILEANFSEIKTIKIFVEQADLQLHGCELGTGIRQRERDR